MTRSLKIAFTALVFIGAIPLKGRAEGWRSWFVRTAARTEPVKKIWIFKEKTFVGDFNSRLALAEAFSGAETTILDEITEDGAEEFLKMRFGKTNLAAADWPDLIVHSLAKDHEIDLLLDLKKRSRNKIFITLMDGSAKRSDEIDLIVNSRHMPQVLTGKSNVARPLGLPSRITPSHLDDASAEYEGKLGRFPGPIVTLLLGGQAANTVFSMAEAKTLGEQVRKAVKGIHGSLFVSNSRRTPDKAFRALLEELTGFPVYVHDVKQDEGNPYAAFLAYADHIIVTGDSSSMVSDALATGKPVYTYAPNSILEDRHKRFLLSLMDAGYLRLLGENLDGEMQRPLDVADDLRDLIEARRKSCDESLASR